MTQEVRAANHLHREEEAIAVGPHELVKADEVRVNDAGERPELLFELVERCGVEVEESLQGDALPALEIARQVDGPNSAAPDAAEHLEPLGPLPVDLLGRSGRGEILSRLTI